MPELPEVETIRLQLDQKLKNRKIAKIEVLNKKSFLGDQNEILGRKVTRVDRRAKILLINLADDRLLAVHLKLTGQLIYRDRQDKTGDKKNDQGEVCEKEGPFAVCQLPNKFTRVIIAFDNDGRLFFNDLRIFGWMKVVRSAEELGVEKLGPEANDERTFTLEYFKDILSKTKKPVKLVILDQEKLAGVGNIYANEALFMAGIMPARPANRLKDEEARRLREAIIKVLCQAIENKGTSDRDEAYRQTSGEKGEHQHYLLVYGKAGQPCPGCGGKIERVTIGGRGTFFCRKCQR